MKIVSLKQYKLNKPWIVALVVFALFASLATIHTMAAGTASLSLSPSSGTYTEGSTISVTVNVTSSQAVNTVQADVTYDTAKLDYTGFSFSGTAFDFALGDPAESGNTVSVLRGKIGSVTGTNKLVTLSFRVLGNSGTSSLSFKDSSVIVEDGGGDIWNHSAAAVSYTLAPVPAAPPAGGGGGGTTNNNNSSGGSNPITPPTDSGQPSDEDKTVNAALDDNQPVVVDTVKDSTGYLVAVKVVDKDGNPVADTEVVLNDQTVKTDSTGVASFNGVVAGAYTIKALGNEQEITITTNDPTQVQSFVITESESGISKYILYGAIGLGAIALLVAGYLLFKRFRGGSGLGGGHIASSGHTAVVGGEQQSQSTGASVDLPQQETVIRPTAPQDQSTRTN